MRLRILLAAVLLPAAGCIQPPAGDEPQPLQVDVAFVTTHAAHLALRESDCPPQGGPGNCSLEQTLWQAQGNGSTRLVLQGSVLWLEAIASCGTCETATLHAGVRPTSTEVTLRYVHDEGATRRLALVVDGGEIVREDYSTREA